MSGRYINWSDVVGRWNRAADVADATQADSYYIAPSESYVEGRLGAAYTAPFSSNNLTAKDLMIDETYWRMIRLTDSAKAKELRDYLDTRYSRLISGDEAMITTSGDMLIPGGRDVIWSSTEEYVPVFGVLDVEDQTIDPDQIEDEINERS